MNKLEGLRGNAEKLEKAVVDYLADVSKVEEQIKALWAELDKLDQEQQPKPWPQVGDEYWFVSEYGQPLKRTWNGYAGDQHRLSTGNCRRTEAEALAYREWQADPRVVARGMIERMEGFYHNGYYEIKYLIDDKVIVDKDKGVSAGLRFESHSSAQAVVDKHPDLCKVALGVITGEEAERIVREAMGEPSGDERSDG